MADIDVDALVTANELARTLGLRDAQAVLDLRRGPIAFPSPVGRRNRALVWSWYEVETWCRSSETSPHADAGPARMRH
jgi:hypothetical protein